MAQYQTTSTFVGIAAAVTGGLLHPNVMAWLGPPLCWVALPCRNTPPAQRVCLPDADDGSRLSVGRGKTRREWKWKMKEKGAPNASSLLPAAFCLYFAMAVRRATQLPQVQQRTGVVTFLFLSLWNFLAVVTQLAILRHSYGAVHLLYRPSHLPRSQRKMIKPSHVVRRTSQVRLARGETPVQRDGAVKGARATRPEQPGCGRKKHVRLWGRSISFVSPAWTF